MEFLVRFRVAIPPEMDDDRLEAIMTEERKRGDVLWSSGRILRLWRIPGTRASIAIYRYDDATQLHKDLSTLPLFPYMTDVTVEPLAAHPGEPAHVAAEAARSMPSQ